MDATTIRKFAIHPGEYIKEELAERNWTQSELAYVLNRSVQSVNTLLNGKSGVTPDLARLLSEAFGVSAELFLNLQNSYDLANAQEPDPKVSRRARLISKFPVREMTKRGWLSEGIELELLEAEIGRFFGKVSIEDALQVNHAAKKTDYSEVTFNQLCWLFRVRQIASEMVPRSKFSTSSLKNIDKDLEPLLTDPEGVRHVPRILDEYGIRFVVVESLPSSKIDGACFWLDNWSPVIGISSRFDRIDNFWFVLRHEIEHVKNGDGKETEVIDCERSFNEFDETLPEEEIKANKAAANFCVDSEQFISYFNRKNPYFYERDLIAFSRIQKRHPGIVAGQLRKKLDRWTIFQKHLVSVRKFLLSSATYDGWGNPYPINL